LEINTIEEVEEEEEEEKNKGKYWKKHTEYLNNYKLFRLCNKLK
jgi:hypothetical protein